MITFLKAIVDTNFKEESDLKCSGFISALSPFKRKIPTVHRMPKLVLNSKANYFKITKQL